MGRQVVGAARRRIVRWAACACVGLFFQGLAVELHAQNQISVPFTSGFIGNRGPSAGSANNVLTYATLGIARTFFIQSSSTSQFELQGNDIPGTLRIVRTDGTTLDIPASVNWRNSGGTTFLIGILPRPASPITFAYSGGSIQITDGSVNGGSSVGGYVAAHTGTMLTDGQSTSGNAALNGALDGLNTYLATVVSSRPAGPVTVDPLTTSNSTPTITGTATLGSGESLSIVIAGVQYTPGTSPAVSHSGGTWSLTLATPLAVGTYSVTATITNADGFTLSDPTANELVIQPPPVTLAGTFTANDKIYDGTASATGTTSGLTLVGVTSPHQVTIASVTLAFATATVGDEKPVVITAVTLGGADAAQYTSSVAGAPTATAAVTPRPLTVGGSFAAANKVYDGTTAAAITTNNLTLVNGINGDDVSLTGVGAAFADPDVGTGKPVSLTTASLSGAAAGNYSLSLAGAPTTTANITAAGGTVTVSGSFTADDKVYDGTVAATGHASGLTLDGVMSPADVTISSVTFEFVTPAVGVAKEVVITAVTLGGVDAAAYAVSLAGSPTATAAVTPRPVTIGGSFTAANKVYDGSTAAAIMTNNLTLVDAINGDDVALTGVSAAFDNPGVGSGKPVSLTAASLTGAAAGNYLLSLAGAPGATADILAAAPPSAPRNVKLVPGDRSISIQWEAPAQPGCSAISGYILEYSTDGGHTWTRLNVTAATPTSTALGALENNVGHTIRIAAVNSCGTGPFAPVSGPAVPMGPGREGDGRPTMAPPGVASSTRGGSPRPITLEIVNDTIIRLADGGFALDLHAGEVDGGAIPPDDSGVLQLEHDGWVSANGKGFAGGTFATMYLITPGGGVILLGVVAVGTDGSFEVSSPLSNEIPPGFYTVQVVGIDQAGASRSVSLGVEVVPPPAELILTATPSVPSPAIGDSITITLTVTNVGKGPAIDVVIPRAFQEAGFSILTTTPLEGAYDAGRHEWTIGRIEPGASARMLLHVLVVPVTASPGTQP